MTRSAQCECAVPGDCQRHGIQKDQHLFKLCQVRGPLNFDGWWGYYGEGGQATSGQPPQCAHGGKTDECPRCLAQLNNWSLLRESDKRQAHTLPIGEHTYRLIEGGCKQCKVGSWLWPAGLALAHELSQRDLRGLTCLDLGCGLGLAGMVAVRRGAAVTWADKEQVTALKCEENITTNGLSGRVLVHDWAHTLPQKFDMIVAGDILYGDLDRLREFVAAHWTGRGPCLLADSLRGHERFAKDLGRHGITLTTRELHGSLIDGRTFAVDLMELRKVQPGEKLLTIGMAVKDDPQGVLWTLMGLKLYHDLADCELIVVDNGGCEKAKDIAAKCGARYILANEIHGTAYPRDLLFREAKGQWVLCLDSHVLLGPGSIDKLKDYLRTADRRDLLSGPILTEGLHPMADRLKPTWGAGMLGQWDRPEVMPSEPCEIWAMGLGAFCASREQWIAVGGFNPAFRGFGGEEGYIHEKFRRAGGKCLSLPWLTWWHRFNDGRIQLAAFFRNNLIARKELGEDATPVIEHYKSLGMGAAEMVPAIQEVYGANGEGTDGGGGKAASGNGGDNEAGFHRDEKAEVRPPAKQGRDGDGDNGQGPSNHLGEVRDVRASGPDGRSPAVGVPTQLSHVTAQGILDRVREVTDREYAGQQQAAAEFGP